MITLTNEERRVLDSWKYTLVPSYLMGETITSVLSMVYAGLYSENAGDPLIISTMMKVIAIHKTSLVSNKKFYVTRRSPFRNSRVFYRWGSEAYQAWKCAAAVDIYRSMYKYMSNEIIYIAPAISHTYVSSIMNKFSLDGAKKCPSCGQLSLPKSSQENDLCFMCKE